MPEITMVRIQKDLMKKIRVEAAKEEKTIQQWVDDTVRRALRRGKK